MVDAIWIILLVLSAAAAAALGVVLNARLRSLRKAQACLAAVQERLQEAERQIQARHEEDAREAEAVQSARDSLGGERDAARAEAARLRERLTATEAERDSARGRVESLERAAREAARAAGAGAGSESERLTAALGRAENDLELSAQRAQRFEEEAARLREEVARLKEEISRVESAAEERVRRQQQVAEQRVAELQKRRGGEGGESPTAAPAAGPATGEAPAVRRRARVADAAGSGKTVTKVHVLLVDSQQERARKALAKQLEAADHEVSYAANAEEAMSRARSGEPAVVILDTEARGLDGWGLLREMKADAATRDIPVILVAPGRDRERALDLGAAQSFPRPLDPTVVLGAVRSAVLARKNRERRMVAAARVSAMTSSPGVPFEEVVAARAASRAAGLTAAP